MIIFIIYLVVLVALTLVLRKLFNSAWKATILVFVLGIVILGIIGLLVYDDVKTISNSPKLFLVDFNNKIQTGYSVNGEQQEIITKTELTEINTNYALNDLESMAEGETRLFIIDAIIFEESPDEITFESKTFQKQNLLNALKTETSDDFLTALGSDTQNLGIIIIQEDELIQYKAAITGILLSNMAENPSNLVKSLTSGNIEIYPNSITTFLINQLPPSLIQSQLENQIEGIET